MALRLLTGSSGSGKTGRAIKIFKQYTPLVHQHSVRFIVPTVSQAQQLKNIILADPQYPGILGDPICTFYDLARSILSAAKLGKQKRISEMQKLLMLKEIISQSSPGYFDGVRNSPNFPDALGGAIGSLKLAEISPDGLRNAVESACGSLDDSSRRKLLDLASLYHSYQTDVLESRGVHDPEGVLWRALVVASENPDLLEPYKCIILDGFSMLTPVQQDFIKVLADNCDDVIVTLEYDRNRPDVFAAAAPDLQFLSELSGNFHEELPRRENGSNALAHLQKHLFTAMPPKTPPDDSLTILAGATPAMEVELVAEEIKKLVRNGVCAYTDIGVAARSIEPYRQRIVSAFRQYGIPLCDRSMPMSESALVRTILICFRIVLDGWKREHVLAALKSTYITCSPDDCSRIEYAAVKRGKKAGKGIWFDEWDADDSTFDIRTSALRVIAEFDDDIKAAADTESVGKAIEKLVGNFRWHEKDEALQEDYAVWKSIRRIIADIVAGKELLGKEIDYRDFAELLDLGIRSASYSIYGRSSDGVSLLDANALGGRKFKIIFLIGLLEKVFPRQSGEDPFIRDSERTVLNEFLPKQLPLSTESREYERYLFCIACESAYGRLYLCYPAADVSAKDSLPSFYLDDVRALFEGNIRMITRDLREVVPPVENAGYPEALLAGVILGCCIPAEQGRRDLSAAGYNLLLESGRLSGKDFAWWSEPGFELSDAMILGCISAKPPVYRVTDLENYGACPFSYFCQKELKLSEVEEEPGALERGSILHSVLFRLYSSLFADGRPAVIDIDASTNLALQFLDDSISQYDRIAAMPEHLCKIERNVMADMLIRFLRDDLTEIKAKSHTPSFFELEFGASMDKVRERSDMSTTNRFKITLSDGSTAEISGKIDRVDIDSEGKAILIDYKSGNCPAITGIENGTLLQAPLYSSALKELFGKEPVKAEYRSLRSLERKSLDCVGDQGKIDTALGYAESHIMKIRSGNFPVKPVECRSYCGFGPVCRIDKWKLLAVKDQLAEESNQVI